VAGVQVSRAVASSNGRIILERRDLLSDQDGAKLSKSRVVRSFSQHALITGTLIAFVLGILFQFFANYWQLVILAGVVAGLIVKRWLRGFIAGFVGVLLSWVIYLAYLWIISPAPRLISILGDIVGMSGLLLVCLVTLIASLFGGLGAVIGAVLQAMIPRQQ
jgi:uncharacterized protein YqhQ